MIALAAGCALVAARLWIGRGGALLSVMFYMLVRGGVSLVVAGIIGQLWAAVPLYFAEALCVELAAPALARRPLPFGAASGVLIGTAGFAAEYGWSHIVMRLPWTGDILPEGIIMAVAGGVAGGLLGALLVLGIQGRLPRPAIARPIFAVSLVVIAAAVTNGLLVTVPRDVRVSVALTDLAGNAGDRSAGARVTISPADAVKSPSWVTITAWHSGGLHVDRLVALGDGSYRTTGRMPLSGEWKTLVRMQDGRSISAVPIYLPDDPAIGGRRLPAVERSTRPVQDERRVLQRELKHGVPGWLWTAASLVVLCCTLARSSRSPGASPAWPIGCPALRRRIREHGAPRISLGGHRDPVLPADDRRRRRHRRGGLARPAPSSARSKTAGSHERTPPER